LADFVCRLANTTHLNAEAVGEHGFSRAEEIRLAITTAVKDSYAC
jgi:hypothetical protein